jgi:Spy/CpxP family protein refolding chaperone
VQDEQEVEIRMFRRLVIISTILVSLTATTALAQSLRGRQAQPGKQVQRGKQAGQLRGRALDRNALSGRALQRLQQGLNLTETQMNGLRALQESRRTEVQSLQQEVQQKRQALRELLRAPSPNTNDVGNATLALKESRERMRDINQRFTSGLKGLLTPEQMQKLPKRLQ